MAMAFSSSSSSSLARLRIVAINDVYELTNLPKLQTFLAKLSPYPSAVVLAGDFLSPSVLSSVDGGRGMVATLRSTGLTHVSLGNHEQDLPLNSLRDRLVDLGKSATIVNSNLRKNVPPTAEWITEATRPYSIVSSPCGGARVALLGLLSDEPGVFRDDTFRSIPIGNVLESYSEIHSTLLQRQRAADLCIPLTHESLPRDRELARHMLLTTPSENGLIIGGHEHDPYDEIVTLEEDDDSNNNAAAGGTSDTDGSSVRILKAGMDAQAASLIDLSFELCSDNNDDDDEQRRPRLVDIEADLVELKTHEPSVVVQQIVDKHTSVMKAFENEVVVDVASTTDASNNNTNASSSLLPPTAPLSSERTRFQQTTVGAIFCRMIKEELEVDACVINGATIKGGTTYENRTITYAQLKKELPFPTKMVIVPMKPSELLEAIRFSRTNTEEKGGTTTDSRDGAPEENKNIPRRGYLQVDWDFHRNTVLPEEEGEESQQHTATTATENTMDTNGGSSDSNNNDEDDGEILVALPRNLLNGFCNIRPLIDLGKRLKKQGRMPGADDYIPANQLVIRHACKHRWWQLIRNNAEFFDEFDLNHDGVLDRSEIKRAMEDILGYEPAEFLVDDMISYIDEDKNGIIDRNEFASLLKGKMEKEEQEQKANNNSTTAMQKEQHKKNKTRTKHQKM